MSSLLIEIVFNGELKSVFSNSTLLQILEQEGYAIPPSFKDSTQVAGARDRGYVAAVNQRIISAEDYRQYQLQALDAVDVLGVITGG